MLICCSGKRSFRVSEIDIVGPTSDDTYLLIMGCKRASHEIAFDDKGECLFMRDLLTRCMDPRAGVVVYPFSLMDDVRFLREET